MTKETHGLQKEKEELENKIETLTNSLISLRDRLKRVSMAIHLRNPDISKVIRTWGQKEKVSLRRNREFSETVRNVVMIFTEHPDAVYQSVADQLEVTRQRVYQIYKRHVPDYVKFRRLELVKIARQKKEKEPRSCIG